MLPGKSGGSRQLELGTASSGAIASADGSDEFGLPRSDSAQLSQRELLALCDCTRDCFSWHGGVLALLSNFLGCFSLSLLPE